ncbi:MAG: HdeD family acid-resistance protein [Proteobacteria bacterium]|nr:HdeD family acid-resistance protein [Pseudomonadota bacterium]
MSAHPSSLGTAIRAGFEQLHAAWGWFVALGIALIVLGAACILGEMTATLISVVLLGWLLLISGVLALVHAFQTRTWSGFLIYLLSALLRLFTGFMLVRFPVAGAAGITFLLALLFIGGGTFRAIGAGKLRFPRWGWAVASGLISVALGVTLLVQFPLSSLWFIGLAIGVDLIFEGTSLVALGSALHGIARRLPGAGGAPAAS